MRVPTFLGNIFQGDKGMYSPPNVAPVDNLDITFAQQVPGSGDGGTDVLGLVLIIILILIIIGGCAGGGYAVYRQNKRCKRYKQFNPGGMGAREADSYQMAGPYPIDALNNDANDTANYEGLSDVVGPSFIETGMDANPTSGVLLESAAGSNKFNQEHADDAYHCSNPTCDVEDYQMAGQRKFNQDSADDAYHCSNPTCDVEDYQMAGQNKFNQDDDYSSTGQPLDHVVGDGEYKQENFTPEQLAAWKKYERDQVDVDVVAI